MIHHTKRKVKVRSYPSGKNNTTNITYADVTRARLEFVPIQSELLI